MSIILPEELETGILFDYYTNNMCVCNPSLAKLSGVSKKWNDLIHDKTKDCSKYEGFGRPICIFHDIDLLQSCFDIIIKITVADSSIIYIHGPCISSTLKAISFLQDTIGLNLKICHFCCDGLGVCVKNRKTNPNFSDFAWYLL
jgi:hypothetical protein